MSYIRYSWHEINYTIRTQIQIRMQHIPFSFKRLFRNVVFEILNQTKGDKDELNQSYINIYFVKVTSKQLFNEFHS